MSKMFLRIKKAISFSSKDLQDSKNEVYKKNMRTILFLSLASVPLFLVVMLYLTIRNYVKHTGYLAYVISTICIVVPFIVFIILNLVSKKKKIFNEKNILIYATVVYVISLLITILFSVFITPNQTSLFYLFYIILLPIILIINHCIKFIINTISIVLYIILAINYKTCDLHYDIFEAVTAYFLSICSIVFTLKQRLLNDKINAKYQNYYLKDNLTNVFNRVTGKEKMQEYLKNVSKNEQYALAFIDLDNFKIINDTYGHIEGDKCLQKIAAILQENVSDDILCRFGGDEFLYLIKNTTESQVIKKLEDILSGLKNLSSLEGKDLNCSIGVYLTKGKDNNLEEIIDKADKILYEAKNNGKGQFIIRK